MNSYECAVVFYPTIGDEGVKAGMAKYASVIVSGGGELTRVETWGKRKLAFEIAHQSEGYYYFYKFRAKREVLNELVRQFRIDETVLRHLIIRDELAAGNEAKLALEGLQAVESGPREGN